MWVSCGSVRLWRTWCTRSASIEYASGLARPAPPSTRQTVHPQTPITAHGRRETEREDTDTHARRRTAGFGGRWCRCPAGCAHERGRQSRAQTRSESRLREYAASPPAAPAVSNQIVTATEWEAEDAHVCVCVRDRDRPRRWATACCTLRVDAASAGQFCISCSTNQGMGGVGVAAAVPRIRFGYCRMM
jgi:hypothetical protein